MGKKFIKGRTSTYRIQYRLSWCTLYSQRILFGKERRIEQLIYEEERVLDVVIDNVDILDGNKVSILVSAPPNVSITTITKSIKGHIGRKLLKEYPGTKKLIEDYAIKNQKSKSYIHFWNGSSFIETIGKEDDEERRIFFKEHGDIQK